MKLWKKAVKGSEKNVILSFPAKLTVIKSLKDMSQHGENQQGQDQTLLSQQAGQVVPHSSSPARPTVGKGGTETQPSKIPEHGQLVKIT